MADDRPSVKIRDFSRRLWLAGGRDQTPADAMRRCVGASAQPGRSVKSRWGSSQLYSLPGVLSLTKFNGIRYQYDGASLYKNGVSLDTGYNGGRLAFVTAPPAFGVADYLFLTGGGKFKKIDSSGNLTNWGIKAPFDGMVAATAAQDDTAIDSFDSHAANWSGSNANLANEATIVYDGAGSLKVTPTGASWSITTDLSASPLNLATYANGDISLSTDVISFWLYLRKPTQVVWMWLEFDVNQGDFKTDYYRLVVQLVPSTDNTHAANADVIISADSDRWFQVAAAKSQFQRIGTNLNFDWSAVKKIRFEGGNPGLLNPAAALYLDKFEMFGGAALGAGPAALQNGSSLQYLVTFGSDITGNDSNPNDTPILLGGVKIQPASLSRIPVSADTQVTNRKLWRTSENGAQFAYLDTIPDNTTTTYTDTISSIAGPIITTPWFKSATISAAQVTAGYYVDGGNGFYFKETAAGPVTTGASLPTWNVPNIVWSPLQVIDATGEIILPVTTPSNSSFKVQTAGTTGKIEPKWSTAPNLGNTITDGTVVWVNNGALSTTDNTATWKLMGVNALRTLGNDVVRFDNTPFPATANDAVFSRGSMFVTRDTATGSKGNVYISPPGRSEGYGIALTVGTDDDPCQKLVVWDEQVFLFTSKYIYPLAGTYPAIAAGEAIQGARGTVTPFATVPTPYGIVHHSFDEIRIFSRAMDVPLVIGPLAPIEFGSASENVSAFIPTIAAFSKHDEILFSDGAVMFAFSLAAKTWRIVGNLACTALYYEEDTGVLQAAVGNSVLNLETDGVLTDSGAPIPIEWQTASVLADAGQQVFVKRLFVAVNCAGQSLTPVSIVDGTETTMPLITNAATGIIEMPIQQAGKVVGVRFTGNVTQQIELFGCQWEVR